MLAEDDELLSNVPTPFPRGLAQDLMDECEAEDLGLDSISTDTEQHTPSPARLTVQVPADSSTVDVWLRLSACAPSN